MKKNLILSLCLSGAMTVTAQPLPYQNPNLSAEERANDLVSRLTLEEKVQLMMDVSPAIPRLGIPAFQWWNEALHGIGRNSFATVFPITMGMAASWNDGLVQQAFTAVSDEARAKNQIAKKSGTIRRYQGLSFWTPNINIFRDPRWGRGQETYGEDPYLTSRMGVAVVRGLQGPDDSKYRKLLACAKHFAVHSGPEWNRHSFNVENLPARDLWETYMPAFKALVQEGKVAEVMCAYQRIDGAPCCGNTRYEQQILRNEWGFDGLIVSDCGAISDFWQKGKHEVSSDAGEASARAVLSGTDVECGSNYKSLPQAISEGQLHEEDLNVSVKRLLKARFELGDFDDDSMVPWTAIPASVIASKPHRDLAYRLAQQSIVLLQNNDHILPLRKSDAKRIVVMGPNANDSVMMWGNYNGFPIRTTTILQGIREKAGNVKYINCVDFTSRQVLQSVFSKMKTADGKNGMLITYWNNEKQEGTPVTTVCASEPLTLSNGGATVFAPGVNLEHFSAKVDGYYTATEDETITLSIACDDEAQVTVNGKTEIKTRKRSDKYDLRRKEINMKAGDTLHIVVDYVQKADMATLNFDLGRLVEPTNAEVLKEVGDADVVLFVGGISPRLEGEEMKVDYPGFKGGDRLTIELPQVQRDMVAMLKQAGKHVVFVNCSGSAVGLLPETKNCDAILQAWYGGESGGKAVADVLFGDYNPSGKLPVTFYKSDADLPDFEEYRMANRTYRYFKGEPLFAFGYGLSYTTFTYGTPEYKKGKLTVTVSNSGKCDGDEVVQVYLRKHDDPDGPNKTLRAYKRISLKAGASESVEIDLPKESFEWWDHKTNTMRVLKGKYDVMVGNHTITVKI